MELLGFKRNGMKNCTEEDEDFNTTEELETTPEVEEGIQVLNLNDLVEQQQESSSIVITLKSFLGKGISQSTFNRMIHIAWEANRNSDLGFEKNSDGHLVAPIDFWQEVVSFVNYSESENKPKIGFSNDR